MNTKLHIRQIQLLGSTYVSGYFAFAELVNYRQFNQKKVIKRFESYGKIGYNFKHDVGYNVIKQDDTIGNIFFAVGDRQGNLNYTFTADKLSDTYVWKARYDCLLFIPTYFSGSLEISGNCYRYSSSNKSYSEYIVIPKGESIIFDPNSGGLSSAVILSPIFSVAYIDMCINTTEPITLNYVGEAEFIQNSNIDNNFTPLFKINRYDYNCY